MDPHGQGQERLAVERDEDRGAIRTGYPGRLSGGSDPAALDVVREGELATRRRLLKGLIRIGYGAFALAFALPALAIRTLSLERKTVAAGDALVYASGDRSGQPVNAAELEAGQAVHAFPNGKADNPNNLVELVRLAGDVTPESFAAYSAICTHLGCTVNAQLGENDNIACPCHGSLFDPSNDAAVVRGPASRPLPSLPIRLEADGTIAVNGDFSGPVGVQ